MPNCPACGLQVDPTATQCNQCGGAFAEPEREFWESRLSPQQEAALKPPGWLLPVLGIAGIGGGAWGMLAMALAISGGQFSGWLNGIIALAMVVLDAFAVWCGVMALQRRRGWLRANLILWTLQVVKIMSPVLGFTFSVGAFLTPYVSGPPLRVGVNAWIGSVAQINLFTPMPWGIGINVLALAMVVVLFRLETRAAVPAG